MLRIHGAGVAVTGGVPGGDGRAHIPPYAASLSGKRRGNRTAPAIEPDIVDGQGPNTSEWDGVARRCASLRDGKR